MKENEAPEKIILSADRETGVLYDEWVIRDLTDNIKIEYTRTDVFIEKACNLLAKMIWEVTYEDLEGNSVQHHDKMKFIEDFRKNYMKGE